MIVEQFEAAVVPLCTLSHIVRPIKPQQYRQAGLQKHTHQGHVLLATATEWGLSAPSSMLHTPSAQTHLKVSKVSDVHVVPLDVKGRMDWVLELG